MAKKNQRRKWSVEFDRGFKSNVTESKAKAFDLTLVPGKVLSLIFREDEDGERLYNRVPAGRLITLKLRVTQSPDIQWDTNPMRLPVESTVPRASIVFARTANGKMADGISNRFYSASRIDIDQPGILTLSVPVDPAHWINVYAHLASSSRKMRDNWRDTLLNEDTRIGIGFGGYFYSKGIALASGSAKIEMLSLDL
jgi:hypothetical protein